ncbi:MAG: type II toxin-antitoxin system MqsA family antitoxin [Dehalococcoidia bacterium]
MKCSTVEGVGEYEHRQVTHTVRRGDRVLVIDHVPAEVYSVCGDVLFTPETTRRIEVLRDLTVRRHARFLSMNSPNRYQSDALDP